MANSKNQRIYELRDAINLQDKALRTGDFFLWRGARMCINAFFGTSESLTREEFDRRRMSL